ncbi:MAG: hypothetical protein ACREJO_03495 [Phycisphaerales bacterium]
MDQLKDAAQFLFDKGHASNAKPITIPITQDTDGRYLLVDSAGKHEVVIPQIRPRQYQAKSLDAVVDLVNHFAERLGPAAPARADGTAAQEMDRKAGRIFVWIGGEAITVLLDEGNRRERVSFALSLSKGFELLTAFGEADEKDEPESHKQKEFIDLLRRQINGMYAPGDIITQVRGIKFARNEQGQSQVATGRESMGASVEASLVGADSFPDDLLVNVPVYDNVRDEVGRLYIQPVDCCLDINLVKQTFMLRPKAGVIEMCRQVVDSTLRAVITERTKAWADRVFVFCGKPE